MNRLQLRRIVVHKGLMNLVDPSFILDFSLVTASVPAQDDSVSLVLDISLGLS